MRNPDSSVCRLASAFILPLVAMLAAACAPGANDAASDDEAQSTNDDALTQGGAISRADQWVNAELHYCQAANHERDYDGACSKYCNRKDNKSWDPYRSDCSGLVSWAWGLPAPGRVTTEFAPFKNDITHEIEATDLKEGDAVNNSDHIMLFKAWVNHGTRATFIEEPGCSSATPYAHEFTSNVTMSGHGIHVDYNGMSFTAIRYNGIKAGAPTQAVPPEPTACDIIKKGEGLGQGHSIKSCNGDYDFVLQTDGNLVIYKGSKALWASHTEGSDAHALIMQSDGNLVLYDSYSSPLWASNTSGHPGADFHMQNDGNAVIYAGKTAYWASHTTGK